MKTIILCGKALAYTVTAGVIALVALVVIMTIKDLAA